jgi:glycosyltransferase involved in cell wall biosynthesis
MRVAQVAPLHISVPPQRYGGTERCISNLTESLVQLGHDVTLFATGDSSTSARLVAMRDAPIRFNFKIDAVAAHLVELSEVYRREGEFDVIHSHLDYLTAPFARASATPTVITLHGRLDGPENEAILRAYRELHYIPISNSQQTQVPDLNWLPPVHHGVDVGRFPFYDQPGRYLVFVGRIAPEKGPDRAIAIAKRAGIQLKIAANIAPADRAYFEQEIKPLLDDPHIEFLGAVNERRKQELMGQALALLLPITWPEPFGMVFIEALACGTPVLTCPYGSAPELLVDGVTGYLCDSDEELAEKALQIAGISRSGCRDHVRRRFDVLDMTRKYLAAYSLVQCRAPGRPGAAILPSPALDEQDDDVEEIELISGAAW